MNRILVIVLLCAVLMTGCINRTDEYFLSSDSNAPSTASPSHEVTPEVNVSQADERDSANDSPAENTADGAEEDRIEFEDAPDFTLKDLSGNSVSLSDFRGKIVFLNIWQTWCPPCQEELPLFQKLADENEDVTVLTVIPLAGERVPLADAEEHVQNFLADKGFTFSVLVDSAPDGGIARSGRYAGNVVPMNFVIGGDGKLYVGIEGAYTWDIIEKILDYMRAL